MKFTSQEEYGLRCLLQLARDPGGFGTIHEIAKREELTPAYVAKLLGALRRGGLVSASRGHNGGYTLARPAAQISLSEVLATLGSRLYSTDFCRNHAGNGAVCAHNADCSIRPVWMGLDQLVHRALSGISLQELTTSERSMNRWVQSHLGSAAVPAQGGATE
jgi:Rrf2 family protein